MNRKSRFTYNPVERRKNNENISRLETPEVSFDPGNSHNEGVTMAIPEGANLLSKTTSSELMGGDRRGESVHNRGLISGDAGHELYNDREGTSYMNAPTLLQHRSLESVRSSVGSGSPSARSRSNVGVGMAVPNSQEMYHYTNSARRNQIMDNRTRWEVPGVRNQGGVGYIEDRDMYLHRHSPSNRSGQYVVGVGVHSSDTGDGKISFQELYGLMTTMEKRSIANEMKVNKIVNGIMNMIEAQKVLDTNMRTFGEDVVRTTGDIHKAFNAVYSKLNSMSRAEEAREGREGSDNSVIKDVSDRMDKIEVRMKELGDKITTVSSQIDANDTELINKMAIVYDEIRRVDNAGDTGDDEINIGMDRIVENEDDVVNERQDDALDDVFNWKPSIIQPFHETSKLRKLYPGSEVRNVVESEDEGDQAEIRSHPKEGEGKQKEDGRQELEDSEPANGDGGGIHSCDENENIKGGSSSCSGSSKKNRSKSGGQEEDATWGSQCEDDDDDDDDGKRRAAGDVMDSDGSHGSNSGKKVNSSEFDFDSGQDPVFAEDESSEDKKVLDGDAIVGESGVTSGPWKEEMADKVEEMQGMIERLVAGIDETGGEGGNIQKN
jgi:hypothetical protein